jgi:glycosyltransferase involved in cell wall biosynthesis
MKQVRILHIISSLKRGGAEQWLYNLITHFQSGYDHHVLFIYDGPIRLLLHQQGISTTQLHGSWPIQQILAVCHSYQPSIIIGSLWRAIQYARVVSKKTGIPLIAVAHAAPEHEGRIRTLLQKLPFGPIAHTVAVSATLGATLSHNTTIINIGIPLSDHIPSPNKSPEHPIILGAVGRFVPVKRFDLLLNSFAAIIDEYPTIQLMIVGTGPLEKKLHQQARDLGIDHAITWIINQPAMHYYQYFDYFIQPSAYESFSLALLEALSFRLPVIMTDHGRKGIITHQKTGFIIEHNNQQALTNGLVYALQHPHESCQWGQAGYQLVHQNYSIQKMCDQYVTLIKQYQ